MRKSILSGYPNTEKWVEKRGAADFEVFGYLIKHSFEIFDRFLKLLIAELLCGPRAAKRSPILILRGMLVILGEIQTNVRKILW